MEQLPEQIACEQGQVRYIYFWVHPEWVTATFTVAYPEEEIRKYLEFIDKIRNATRTAIVRLPFTNTDLLKNEQYKAFLEEIAKVDAYAEAEIGNRYFVWPKKFFDGRSPEDIALISGKFRIGPPEDQNQFLAEIDRTRQDHKRKIARAIVFGKEPDTCALAQASSLWGLSSLAAVVKHIHDEFPPKRDLCDPNKPETLIGDGMYMSINNSPPL